MHALATHPTFTALLGVPITELGTSLFAQHRLLSRLPGGTRLFAHAVTFKAPYFAGLRPTITVLKPGRCEVEIDERRAVRNHIGTVHAIALCNMAELAAGLLTQASTPPTHRWIPVGMTTQYLDKAKGRLNAIASLGDLPIARRSADVLATVVIQDSTGSDVMRAEITMRVTSRTTRSSPPQA